MNLRTRAAAFALTLPVGLGLLAACGDDPDDAADPTASDPAETSSSAPGEPEPTSETPPPSSEPAAEGTVVPVYFTGDTPFGPRLYREFHEVEADNPLEEAAALLVAGDALDPDYGTLLTGVTVDDVEQEDGIIVVTLGEDSVLSADKGLSRGDAAIAVQSLVYTLQGVTQTRDPVRVELADGSPTDLLGQPTSDGVKAGKQLDVLSLVNLTTPAEGAVVDGTSLAVEGVASSFEATVPYVIEDASGATVLEYSIMAEGWFEKLYPFADDVDVSSLAPGEYTLVVRTDDPSGGEGPGPFEDTRTFTIE